MEYMGLIAFVLILGYSSYPSKVKALENEVKKIKKRIGGENAMSKLINGLIGQKCIITTDEAAWLSGSDTLHCAVIDADEEWIKISFADSKGVNKTQIFRIDEIERIDLSNE
ncbi:hypothetical protein V6615_06755 [Oscillospiraceae bacterium PP1C4]